MSRPTKTKPANLSLHPPKPSDDALPQPQPSPLMDLAGIDLSSFGGDFSAGLISLPPLPSSPPTSPRLDREMSSKTFLPSFKSRVASEQDQRAAPPSRRTPKDEDEFRPNSSSMSKIYHLRKNPGSTPELSLVGSAENVHKQSDDGNAPSADSRSQSSPQPPEDSASGKRKERGFRNPLARSKSIRRDSDSKPNNKPSFDQPPKTAPLRSDWHAPSDALLRARGKEKRGKSAERAIASESEDNFPMDRQQGRDRSAFVTGSKNVMHKAKSGGGQLLNRLGKIGRSNSNHETVPDTTYVPQVIILPLVDQTRITRISKDLGSCRDKTEYWMPSLPWRCIDYLNLNCESEGLYRIPGSGPQVKLWQRRFDTELDVDLLDESELYDPNIVSSMLKSWLRDLPTEIFPKAQQTALAEDLAKDNPGYHKIGEPAPQKLRDALSELSPFNYYLLFAITCHLSLLLSHKDKNKMDLNNLSICIGPCLELERWLFNYLVGDWRNCWQGCFTEKHYLEIEKAHEQGLDHASDAHGDQRSDSTSQFSKTTIPIVSNGHGYGQAYDNASRSGSGSQEREDKSIRSDNMTALPTRHRENSKPAAADPLADYARYVNGTVPTPDRKPVPLLPDMGRPSTAQPGAEGKLGGGPAPIASAAKTAAQKAAHRRSHSDLPVVQTSPIDFPFKLRNE